MNKLKQVITVGQLSNYISNVIRTDSYLQNISVEGEVSNFKNSGGNLFFDLKEGKDSISCIVFRFNSLDISKVLEDGKKVVVKGNLTTYTGQSRYQIRVESVTEVGLGKIYEEYLKTLSELKALGLFDQKYKKSINKYPSKIGLITSKEGAALHDVIKVLNRRYPYLDVYFCPVRVQGVDSIKTILKAIDRLDEMNLDLILITRGGGSFEDLHGFNNIELANRVFMASTPIVSAIGHEVDNTIIEMVSDLRGATPTAAAEMITLDKSSMKMELEGEINSINNSIYRRFDVFSNELLSLQSHLAFLNPSDIIEKKQRDLDDLYKELKSLMNKQVDSASTNLDKLKSQLEKYDQGKILEMGYSIIRLNKDVITSIKDVDLNDDLEVELFDGKLDVKVERKVDYENWT